MFESAEYLSFQSMLNTDKAVSEFHDIEVKYWSDAVKEKCCSIGVMQ